MKERYTDQELIDRGLLELSPEGHLQTPMPAYNTGKKMTEQPLELVTGSDWDCETQLDRIEANQKEIIALLTKKKRPNGRKELEYSSDFDELWKRYPERSGGNPKSKAWGAVRSRLAEYVPIEVLGAGLDRYIAYVEAEGMVGGNFVMQAARFFGINKEYENDWKISVKTTAPKTDQEWIIAGEEKDIYARAGESMTELKRRIEVALR
jgi:hypothetical protein